MTNDKETGRPAFPYGDPTHGGEAGMTLRDYFAARAMQLCFDHCTPDESAAKAAYKVADAMLEARK